MSPRSKEVGHVEGKWQRNDAGDPIRGEAPLPTHMCKNMGQN